MEKETWNVSEEDYISALSSRLTKDLARLSQPSAVEDLVRAIVRADIDRIDFLLKDLDSLLPILPFLNRKFWLPDYTTISRCETQADEVKYIPNWDELSFGQWQELRKCSQSSFIPIELLLTRETYIADLYEDRDFRLPIGPRLTVPSVKPGDAPSAFIQCLEATGLLKSGFRKVQVCTEERVPNGSVILVGYPPFFPKP